MEEVRLEKRDAEFVDVIHTDGSAFLGALGIFTLLKSSIHIIGFIVV